MRPTNSVNVRLVRRRRLDTDMIPDELGSLVSIKVLQQAQEMLSSVLGIPVLFVSPTGNPVADVKSAESFCRYMTRSAGGKRPCLGCDRNAGAVRDSNEPYECPLGLLDVVLPIRIGDGVAGHLITSQVAWEPAAPRVLQAARQQHMTPSAAASYASRIPVETADRMNQIAEHLSAVASIISEMAAMAREKKLMQSRDPLTGLVNRDYFWKCLAREIEIAQAHNYPLSVLLVDIDDFGQINDIFGHETGDRVIQTVGHVLAAEIRRSDLAAHYAGDAFLLMLPCSDATGAEVVAWRLRNKIAQCEVMARGQRVPVSVSIGCVTCPDSTANDPDSIFKEAVAALRRAPSASQKAA